MIVPRLKETSLVPIICIFLLAFLHSAPLFSSTALDKKAKRLFDRALIEYRQENWSESEVFALRAIKRDSSYAEPYLLLADLYDQIQSPEKERWALVKIVSLNSSKYQKAFKLLADNYFAAHRFEDALKYYKQYASGEEKPLGGETQMRMEFAEESLMMVADWKKANVTRLGSNISTSKHEYWPFVSADDSTLYFTRLLRDERNRAFERLFFSKLSDSLWEKPSIFLSGLKGLENVGTMTMSADKSVFFFTACGTEDCVGSCDLFYYIRKDNTWAGPYNPDRINTKYWEAQPSLSPMGDYLYWSSNRPGGIGGRDIWRARVVKDEGENLSFTDVENLKSPVNTVKHDYSPFIHADGVTLYYSSEGLYGMGKSDIFQSRLVDRKWQKPKNLGYPINSIANDDGLVISPSGFTGFLSSDRLSAVANSKDIFKVELPELFKPVPTAYVKGYVFDAKTRQKISAEISLKDISNEDEYLLRATENEGYIATVHLSHQYVFNIVKKGYLFYSGEFNLKDTEDVRNARVKNVFLEPIQVDKKVVMKNIYFEFDKAVLLETSKTELDKVVEFMQANLSVQIQISGHTDNVGDEKYNMELSKQRARAIVDYLSQYVDSDRFEAVGFGSQFPVATNETESGRSKNRRSELKILSL